MCENFEPDEKVMKWISSEVSRKFGDKIKVGDVIRCVKDVDYNEGCFVWNGVEAVALRSETYIDVYGYLPEYFVFDDVESEGTVKVDGPDHWLNCEHGIVHNSVIWPSQRLRQMVAAGLKRGVYRPGVDRFFSCMVMQDGRRFPFILDSSHFNLSAGTSICLAKGMIMNMRIPFVFSAVEEGKLTLVYMDDRDIHDLGWPEQVEGDSIGPVQNGTRAVSQTFGQFEETDRVTFGLESDDE
jgi:hypothetical protein